MSLFDGDYKMTGQEQIEADRDRAVDEAWATTNQTQRAISPPSIKALRGCPSCGGSGVTPGTDSQVCGSCDGEGMVDW